MPGRTRQLIGPVAPPLEEVLSKTVTAATAAKVMGGFSTPYAGTNCRAAARGEECAYLCDDQAEAEAASQLVRQIDELEANGCLERLFWVADHSIGRRRLDAADDASPLQVPDWGIEGSWWGYEPQQVEMAEYASATSGSTLRWIREGVTPEGVTYGRLEYESGSDPHYRGSYYEAWREAEELA